MRPQSAKSKGRLLQQYVRDILLHFAKTLEPDDIRSTSMGAGGEDILMSPAARRVYPFSIECKNVEKLNIWEALAQARDNAGKHVPVVVFTKNNEAAYIALPIDYFMEVLYGKEEPGFYLNFGSWTSNWISSWSWYGKTKVPKGRARADRKNRDGY